jgi:hypothetical protein
MPLRAFSPSSDDIPVCASNELFHPPDSVEDCLKSIIGDVDSA